MYFFHRFALRLDNPGSCFHFFFSSPDKSPATPRREYLYQRSHKTTPACLVIGAYAGTAIAMKIFIEHKIIFPVRVILEFFNVTVQRPPVIFIAKENIGQAAGYIFSYFG